MIKLHEVENGGSENHQQIQDQNRREIVS